MSLAGRIFSIAKDFQYIFIIFGIVKDYAHGEGPSSNTSEDEMALKRDRSRVTDFTPTEIILLKSTAASTYPNTMELHYDIHSI